MENIAVLSCMGLGDGLISLILSHHLQRSGKKVTTFHPFLAGMQSWFPHLPIAPFPEKEAFTEFDRIFLFYEKSPWMQEILKTYPQAFVLNPIATPNQDYPYWENGKFDGNIPFAVNLARFCTDILGLENVGLHNGMTPPLGLLPRKEKKRVVLHPMSSRPGKNWPKEKYLELARRLQQDGFQPVFILTPQEKKEWEDVKIEAPHFTALAEMAAFVYESGYMIGNDSGIGHLASCCGLPTLTICRNVPTAHFWRPAWTAGKILFPPAWVPNIKWLRLRDKHWKKWISVRRVHHTFSHLIKS